jgi:tRNA pseudouridine38-40 synthase
MRLALKFAYDGQAFEGYARQPKMRTIEGEVISAMESLGIIESAKANNFMSASRTDRGVSAAGNVLAVETVFKRDALISALNSRLGGIRFWALAEVDDDFNPRHAKLRWYRYVIPRGQCPRPDDLRVAAKGFVGEHDFREFSKKDTDEESTVLVMDSIDITEAGDFVYVDFRAHRFLWQLVRRLVTAILERKTSGTGVGPAPAGNLVLMDVVYDFGFDILAEKARHFLEKKTEANIRAETLNQIDNLIASF